MKKITIALVVITLLLIASCTKPGSTGNIGTWTFKGTTYTAKTCSYLSSDSALGASDITGAYVFIAADIIAVHFRTIPTANGTYNVIRAFRPLAPNEAYVNINRLNSGGLPGYESTGDDNKTISVTVSNGKVRATGSNIMLLDDTYGTDSSGVTFDITQQ